jgi:3-hydroxyisobutyrate dehydrogenase
MKPSIALLGLGTMGRGMAANLLKAGFQLTAWNRTRAKAEFLTHTAAKVADSPAQAVKNSSVVHMRHGWERMALW